MNTQTRVERHAPGASSEKATDTSDPPSSKSRDGVLLWQEEDMGIDRTFESSNVVPMEGASDRLYAETLHGVWVHAV